MRGIEKRIKQFNKDLLQDSLPMKYSRMAENAFSFFRGTCHLFYEDLGTQTNALPHSPTTWICGDLHLENFGSFKGNNRLVYFDLNDFGEAVLAPASWEIARIISSIFVAFDSLKIDAEKAQETAELFLETYSSTLRKGKAIYIERQIAKGIVRSFLETSDKRSTKELLRNRTYGKGDKLRLLIDNERHFEIADKKLKTELYNCITRWGNEHEKLTNYRCLDSAFRIAGTGSIGISRYCFLFHHLIKDRQFVLLDMKEVTASSVQPHVMISQPAWQSESERVCAVQEYMQNTSPALLSPITFRKRDYIIKELQPSEDKIDFKDLRKSRKDLRQVINDMAVLLASAQIRSSGRKGSALTDDLISFGNNQSWQPLLLRFAKDYSEEVKQCFEEYKKGYEKGQY